MNVVVRGQCSLGFRMDTVEGLGFALHNMKLLVIYGTIASRVCSTSDIGFVGLWISGFCV